MKFFITIYLCCLFIATRGDSSVDQKYWLVQEDFIRLGKRDLYEAQKTQQLQKDQLSSVITLEDLENPQYVFLYPLKDFSSLSQYPPIAQEKKNVSLDVCLHFQVYSLHELLREASFGIETVIVGSNPYFLYVLYDIVPGHEEHFESEITKAAKQLAPEGIKWCTWRSLFAGDSPKYLLGFSFPNKEEMMEWSMKKVWDEVQFKEMIRDKKMGWMKKRDFLSASSTRNEK